MLKYFADLPLALLAVVTDPFLSRGEHRASKGGQHWEPYTVGI